MVLIPRSAARKRVLLFCAALAAVTALVQWSGLHSFLDGLAGLAWSVALVDFLKKNTQGLIIIVVITLFFEYIGFERSKEAERLTSAASRGLIEAAVKTSPAQALIDFGVAEEYGDDSVQSLGRVLRKSGPVLRDVSVRIEVSPNGTAGYYVVTRLQYRCEVPRFVVAMTSDSLQAEALGSIREINELVVVSDADLHLVPGTQGAPVQVSVLAKKGATEQRVPLAFKPMTARQKTVLLRTVGLGADPDGYAFFEARPGRDLGFTPDESRYSVEHTVVCPPDVPHTFWMADRPLQVRDLEVDLRKLDAQQFTNARVQLMVGAVGWAQTGLAEPGRWSLPINSWLVSGQGVFVVWPRL